MLRGDVQALIDAAPWSARQKWAALLGGLAMLVDGFDNQLLGIAVPAIASDWGVAPADFAPALSAGLVGMLLGNAIGGAIGDRIGRKPALLASMALFGLVTLGIAFVDSLSALLLCRLIGGLGLGATVPNASALVAETTPARKRTLIVTLSTLGSPLGGVVAGLTASAMLSAETWRILFIAGGVVPLLHIIIAAKLLPESPQYLATSARGTAQLPAALAKMGLAYRAATAPPAQDQPRRAFVLATVLAPALRRDTLLLWLVSAANMMALYMLLNWLPAMLNGAGYSLSVSSLAISFFSLGGIAGSILAGWVMQRLGSRSTVTLLAGGAALTGAAIAIPELGAQFPVPLLILALTLLGTLGGAFNVVLFPLALHCYPGNIRGGGFGLVLASGRAGAVMSPFLAVAMVNAAQSHGLFATYAALMLVSTIGVYLIGQHIAPPTRNDGDPA